MHKLMAEKIPDIFTKMFKKNIEVHAYATRQQSHFHTPIYKTMVGSSFIRRTGTSIWNEIVVKDIQNTSIGQFKHFLRQETLSTYG